MRRLSAIMLVFFIIPLCLSAASPRTVSESLTVTGYKIAVIEDGEEHLEMHVYDAVVGSMKNIESGSIVNIDKFLNGSVYGNELFGGTSGDSEGLLIFAFNVEGNTMGDYTVSIKMDPFILMQGDVADSSNKINYYFHVKNDYALFKSGEGRNSIDGAKISYITSSGGKRTDANVSGRPNNEISVSFVVSGLSSTSVDAWAVRGGIGISLDETEYAKAPNGYYKAFATVKLTENT